MTTHPSMASQREKMENPTSQLSPDCCQTEDGLSFDSDAAVDPVLRREFLEELQKVRQISISLLLEIRKGSSTIRMFHELRLLRHRLGISCSDNCEVSINRLKVERKSKVARIRRLEKNRKRLRQNGLFQQDGRRVLQRVG